ncbi:MAG TPA: helix-turn-helix domain-containing protein [Streptosporangiaceae bacterium]|nr:helix-turn-helix domain-containing protein [Streptosporangiaceae bacterium]
MASLDDVVRSPDAWERWRAQLHGPVEVAAARSALMARSGQLYQQALRLSGPALLANRALRELIDQRDAELARKPVAAARKRPGPVPDPTRMQERAAEIVRAARQGQVSRNVVAASLGVSPRTVRDTLRRAGVASPWQGEPVQQVTAAMITEAARPSGAKRPPPEVVAEQFGRSVTALRGIMWRAGAPWPWETVTRAQRQQILELFEAGEPSVFAIANRVRVSRARVCVVLGRARLTERGWSEAEGVCGGR